jgi:hypothetical protein
MSIEQWKCFCFKEAEKPQLKTTLELMLPYIHDSNLADRFGVNLPDKKELIYCTEIWFLNPNETFVKSLLDTGIELSKCLPKDNRGSSVLNP